MAYDRGSKWFPYPFATLLCRIWFVHGKMNSYFVVGIAIHNRTVHRHADYMVAPGSVFNASAYHLSNICALFGTDLTVEYLQIFQNCLSRYFKLFNVSFSACNIPII